MKALDVQGLSVRLGGKGVVDDVDLSVERGRLVGLIGPNGAGKTTVIRALLRLVRIETGRIELLGKPADGMEGREFARTVAYLPQGHIAQWPVKAHRLVALGRLPHLQSWQRESAADRAAVDRAMSETDVAALSDRTVTTLSGGERARVALARALAVEAPILLVDEPVAALDPYHQLQVMELLRRYADTRGTVLAVLHDLALAARFCDGLVLMKAGRVVAEGPPAAVLTSQNLANVYRIEALGGHHHEQRYILPWARIESGALPDDGPLRFQRGA